MVSYESNVLLQTVSFRGPCEAMSLEVNTFLITSMLSAWRKKERLPRLGFRYLSIKLSSRHKQQPCRKAGSSVTHHPSPWSCTITLFTAHLCLVFFSVGPPDHWRLCDGATLWTFSLAAWGKEKHSAYSERLKKTRLSASCTSKAFHNSCLFGNEQAQVGLEISPNTGRYPEVWQMFIKSRTAHYHTDESVFADKRLFSQGIPHQP